MSIGNTNTQGNKRNNFPYQLASLQLLGDILTAVNASAAAATGKVIYPYLMSSTGSDDLSGSPIIYNVSFSNVGASAIDLVVGGSGTISIPAGTTVNYDPGVNNWYEGSLFSWDATGSTLLVAYSSN